MNAAVLRSYNSPLSLSELSVPRVGRREVLVRVKASGTNPLDVKIRNGDAPHANVTLPAVLGVDLAGVVASVGAAVTEFRAGDEVYGMTGGVGNISGSLAQFAVVDADLLALKPSAFNMKEAAAVPLVFITAWEGLVDRAGVRAGQKVLVHGGAGGVGQMAIQIARSFGAEVFATVSGGKESRVTDLGATAINYRSVSVAQYVHALTDDEGFDIIYDTVGGSTLDDSFQAVRKYNGHVVSCLGWGSHSLAPLSFRAATYSGIFTLLPLLSGEGRRHHGDILREATKLADGGRLRVNVDPRNFSLETVAEAHEILEKGTALGKVVINIE